LKKRVNCSRGLIGLIGDPTLWSSFWLSDG